MITGEYKAESNAHILFTIGQDRKGSERGFRPVTDKMVRFNVVLPLFKLLKIWFPLEMKTSPPMAEAGYRRTERALSLIGGVKRYSSAQLRRSRSGAGAEPVTGESLPAPGEETAA